jgi:hypothetical protein
LLVRLIALGRRDSELPGKLPEMMERPSLDLTSLPIREKLW